jgi:hypothetical protein
MDYRTEEAVMEALPFIDDLSYIGKDQSVFSILNRGERAQVI